LGQSLLTALQKGAGSVTKSRCSADEARQHASKLKRLPPAGTDKPTSARAMRSPGFFDPCDPRQRTRQAGRRNHSWGKRPKQGAPSAQPHSNIVRRNGEKAWRAGTRRCRRRHLTGWLPGRSPSASRGWRSGNHATTAARAARVANMLGKRYKLGGPVPDKHPPGRFRHAARPTRMLIEAAHPSVLATIS